MNDFELSPEQEAALTQAERWRFRPTKPYLTLGGYAGTGKTWLVCHLAKLWPCTAVAALSGKAATVLQEKGVRAQTIHRLIFIPRQGPDGKVHFQRRPRLEDVATIIVDEA